MSGEASRFFGGLHWQGHKALSLEQPVTRPPLPQELILPLQQHIGEPALPLVRAGDHVLRGQPIAAAEGYVSAALHAPTSGHIAACEMRPAPHPSGLSSPCIVLRSDGDDRPHPDLEPPAGDLDHSPPTDIRRRIREAGIVGLGGAAFPTAVKLNPGPGRKIDLLILNGAECEPYISCDERLMRDRAADVVQGARILLHVLGLKRCVIGIEDSMPEALEALREAIGASGEEGVQVEEVPTVYPAGGENQLIKALTGLEVPSGGLPAEIGVICQNVGTAVAVSDAVTRGRPLISRLVTVTGSGVRRPANVEALIGTPVSHLIEHCGGYTENVERLIMGGPMMGFALGSDQVPIIKGSNCILAAAAAELATDEVARPCIRCGECARVCPARLLPQQLYWQARARDFDRIQDYNLFDCIECGCCAVVCPSRIPLVQYYRFAKTEIWAQERERRQADLARQRHEARQQRQQREQAERAERMRQRKAKRDRGSGTGDADPRKQAIRQAVERSRRKRQGQAADQARRDPAKGERSD